EVSHGETPSGVTAATAISYLQERDDSAMSTTYQSIEMGYEKVARHFLSHVVQFWDTPRIVKTTGADGFFDAIALSGSEIASGTDDAGYSGTANCSADAWIATRYYRPKRCDDCTTGSRSNVASPTRTTIARCKLRIRTRPQFRPTTTTSTEYCRSTYI